MSENSRRLLSRYGLPALAALLLFAPHSFLQAQIGVQKPPNIKSTPHNLRGGVLKGEADEICIFCHTPQTPVSGEQRAGIVSPVWQPSLGVHSYTMFDDIGRLQFGDKPAVGSQSIACLSCHDSAQAFGVTNSSGDHPFGVPYRGYTPNNRVTPQQPVYDGGGATPGVRRARSLLTFEDFRLPSTAMVDSRSVWWVSANGITARRTRQDLPLYVRNIGGTEVPHVECSSCHDPHSPNPLFLRLVNEQSVLCLTCHDK